MLFVSSANQAFNLVLAMSLVALASAASLELRTSPVGLHGALTRITESAAHADAAAAQDRSVRTLDESASADAADAGRDVPIEMPPVPAPAPFVPIAQATKRVEPSKAVASPEAAAEQSAANMVGGATRAPAAPTEAKLSALPAEPGIIFEDVGRKACIGGTECEAHCEIETNGCEVHPAYVIKLDRPAYISTVQLYAHDEVGPSRRAELLVKVNGEPVGAAEVHRYGSTRTIKVGRVGQLVTVESRHQHNGFLRGGEEAVIWDLYLVGRAPE